MPMAGMLNRMLALFGVKLARSATINRLERELCDEQRRRIELEEERRQSFLVPMHYEYACTPRPHDHVYQAVADIIERDRDRIAAFIAPLQPILHGPQISRIPVEKRGEDEPCWNNPYLSPGDSRMIYAVAAHYRPKTIVEVGSGNSTKFVRQAIRDFRVASQLISIDPAPRAEIGRCSDRIVRQSVLEVKPEFFDVLEPGDVLFIDGSHLVFNGTDVVYLMLEVLPRLRPGVLIHIHDIFLPWEYSDLFTKRGYAEQYLLAALLLGSERWKVLAPVYYLYRAGLYEGGGGSFWFVRE
jgi:Methyltransferase domain